MVSPHRKLLHQGKFKKVVLNKETIKDCHVFLFNDILIFAKSQHSLAASAPSERSLATSSGGPSSSGSNNAKLKNVMQGKLGDRLMLTKKYVNKGGLVPISGILVWDGNDSDKKTFSIVRTDCQDK